MQPPLISFQSNKNISNFLVKSSRYETNGQPGTKQMRSLSMQNLSFHLQRRENVGTREIH